MEFKKKVATTVTLTDEERKLFDKCAGSILNLLAHLPEGSTLAQDNNIGTEDLNNVMYILHSLGGDKMACHDWEYATSSANSTVYQFSFNGTAEIAADSYSEAETKLEHFFNEEHPDVTISEWYTMD